MEKKDRLIEVRTADGKPILNLRLIETQATQQDRYDGSSAQTTQVKDSTSQPGISSADQSLMTDAQKRYLFRLMTDKGIEGDKAHQRLRELFQVDSLKEVSKLEASKMIERLLEEGKGGADEPPF